MSDEVTVVYHSADYDGIFCREIARKFLPEAQLIGWDYGDPKICVPLSTGTVYVLDLDPDCLEIRPESKNVVWIDHHKTAIEKWSWAEIPGYRIDGVAACRLAWHWFTRDPNIPVVPLAEKKHFVARTVAEPLAVRLAGEFDVWDKRDQRAEIFQFGLRSQELTEGDWKTMLYHGPDEEANAWQEDLMDQLLENGELLQRYQQRQDAGLMDFRSFEAEWEGLQMLCLNTAKCNSLTFAAGVKPEHDALMGFFWNGRIWKVSLYGVPHRLELDLALLAKKYGGGGHKQACGFEADNFVYHKGKLTWLNNAAAKAVAATCPNV